MTLRSLTDRILSILRDNSGSLGVDVNSIDFGKYGRMPSLAPFIWVYVEPMSISNDLPLNLGRARYTIFCGYSGDDNYESVMRALELAEKCFVLLNREIYNNKNKSVYGFDQVYADISVAFVEIEVEYEIEDDEV